MKYFSTFKGLGVLILLVSFQLTLQAQCDTNCSISCTGQINLSLGQGCTAEITPWMGGKGIAVGDDVCYSVEVFDHHNHVIQDNIVTIDHVNQLLTYKVTEHECNNYCWGNVLVEYKQGPQIICPPDMTMECNGLDLYELPLPEDLCAAVDISLLKEEHNKLDCDPDYQAIVTRTYKAVDEYGNTNTCSHDIYLRRVPISEIVFPGYTQILCSDENILYDVNGFPLPWHYNSLIDSLDVFGVPFICSNTIESPYGCPGSGIPGITDCGAIITSLDATGATTIGLSLTNPAVSASCVSGNFSLSFSGTGAVTALNFDCTTIGVNTYTIYLLDGATVVGTCTNTIEITDPTGVCMPGGGGTGSGTGSGTPGGGGTGTGGGTTTTTGGGTTTNTGAGAGCTYGIPLFPEGGGIIITETGDPLKPIDKKVFEGNLSYLCGSVLLYNDVEFTGGKNSCKRKIFRTWEAYEWWCEDELHVSSVQIIEIVDDRPPVFDCPSDLTVGTTSDCAANIQMPAINAYDNCGTEITVTMQYPNGTAHGEHGLVDLNAGENTITYVVSDACNNSSTCTVNYMVIDYTNPVAICEQEKVISLGSSSYSSIPASIFDLGSYDDCEIKSMHVRRQDDTCHPDAAIWGEYAYFCCADAIKGVVPVEFRVTDNGGNSSDCIVYVEVQDKANPIINCPPDMTIDCRDSYSESNMGLTFGNGTTSDNCTEQLPHEVVTTDFDQCGVGLMIRSLQILTAGGDVVAECKQHIHVENNDPFTADDISWPVDLTVTDICDVDLLHPDLLAAPHAYPTYAGGTKCALIGYDFEDKVFAANPTTGECAVIQRTWTVVNWCGALGDFDTYHNPVPQLIKIRNNTQPVMDQTNDLVFSGQNVDCNSGRVDIVRTATDDCDNSLTWAFTIKKASDGAIVQTGTSNELHGKFPVGNYNIEWRVWDGCGNMDFHIQFIQVISTKPPTPLCHSGLSAKLIDWDTDGDGEVDIKKTDLWASDFNAGSYPNCGNAMTFSFSSDTTDTSLSFYCEHLGRNNVEMWVTDRLTGAQDFCIAYVDIQDDGDCPQQISATIAGQVMTEMAQEVEDVEVHLDTGGAMEMTNGAGAYAFPQMPTGGNYEVIPQKDIDHLAGISTLDLIMIQRHILGIEELDSPYKLIAADVDGNENIDGIDLVELRKLILGIYTELPQNESWRFVSADYQFVDIYDPWAATIDESYNLLGLNANMVIDFIGVKVGDVNNDAIQFFEEQLSTRSSKVVDFAIPTSSFQKEEAGSLLIYSNNYKDLSGWQGTLAFDSESLEILEIVPRALKLSESNFILNDDHGYVTFSYNAQGEESFNYDEPLFEIKVKAIENIADVLQVLDMNSSVVSAEVYHRDNSVSELRLGEYLTDQSKILSVFPNPFIETAEVKYYSAYDENVEFEFFDLNGQLVYETSVPSQRGNNKMQVKREELSARGFIYLRMRVRGEISEFRMIVL